MMSSARGAKRLFLAFPVIALLLLLASAMGISEALMTAPLPATPSSSSISPSAALSMPVNETSFYLVWVRSPSPDVIYEIWGTDTASLAAEEIGETTANVWLYDGKASDFYYFKVRARDRSFNLESPWAELGLLNGQPYRP
jgi:hypothetical protein